MVEFQGDLLDIGITDASLYLAGGVTAGYEDIVAYLHVSLAHEGGDAIVAAVDEDAVGDADVSLYIHVQRVFISVGITNLGNCRASVGFDEPSGENALVGGAGDFVLYIGNAVEVVFAKVKHKAVNYDFPFRAGVAPGPSCVDVQKRGGEFLAAGLDFGHVLDDVTLGEIR